MTEERYDVVVVGSGGGLIGAFAAAGRGLRTLVIEKAAHVGGTTAYSGAGIWLPGNPAILRAGIEDSPDAARPYLDSIVGDDAPVELREAFLRAGPPMIEELERDEHFGEFSWRGIPDYFEGRPGFLKQGRTIFPRDIDRAELGELEPLVRRPLWTERWGTEPTERMVGGQALTARSLLALMATGNATVHTSTALKALVVEGDRVVGVDAERDGEPVRYLADRGVLLAAGGFERNRELRQRFQAPLTDEWTSGCPENTGDALLAAIEVGADTALLDEAWFAPGLVTPSGGPVFYTMVWGGVWVNAAGERFMNERLPYDRAGHELMRLQNTTDVDHIPAHWVFDQRQVDQQGFRMLPVDPQVPDWFDVDRWLEAGVLQRADTLEELAGLIGVPADALVATVEEYNGFARSGVDERFHRGESPWDRVIANVVTPHTDGPNRCLGVLDAPPWYAVQVVVTDLGTKGGVRTDDHARALRPDGTVIHGLYASGNTMAPATGRVYPGAGGPIGSAMVFSWLAALDMAGEDPLRPPT
ncbi:FAD-dependent oxidoreductase [Dermatobacter hominis]|uniref:FAD-dependent oxidoreductase n=1 Tax=Dermatobacter hominis TaxID=2884263 RepID=UPI001D125CAE|nr:FAD-dependent oxidoreductase [Dermatobacter hominis]UDY36698.1 FAD-dependent oxidoreductase [Dermatobacter hominis]